MISKLVVIRVTSITKPVLRYLSGLSQLERFERLRQLCCTSDIAKKKADQELDCRPKNVAVVESRADLKCRKKALLELRCKNAFILGGASSVGYEVAHNLLMEDVAKVVIGDIDQEQGVKVVKKLCATFGNDRAFLVMTDLTQQSSIELAFKEIYKNVGQLSIYVNCVGIYNETPECWDKMIKTNLTGCVRGTLLALRYFAKNYEDENCQGPVIVNVSSYGSIATIPTIPIFSAASNGINGLTSSFGQDFHYCKNRVRCITVCPACFDCKLYNNLDRLYYNKEWVANSIAAVKCCVKQSPKIVGKAITTVIKHGANGCVYVVKDGNFYRYAMPDYEKIMRVETVLW